MYYFESTNIKEMSTAKICCLMLVLRSKYNGPNFGSQFKIINIFVSSWSNKCILTLKYN